MKYPKKAKLECPHCKGKGWVEVVAPIVAPVFTKSTMEKQKALKKVMKRDDFHKLSLREIGDLVGIRHPQNVKYHLSRIIK